MAFIKTNRAEKVEAVKQADIEQPETGKKPKLSSVKTNA
jgi:hypothetical protein